MYEPGQVIFSFDTMQPVKLEGSLWDESVYPKRHTHFIRSTGVYVVVDKYEQKCVKGIIVEAFCPQSVEEANELLRKGTISPAPLSD